jgi:hypothetical protein
MTISDEDFAALKADVAQIRAELGAIPDFARDGYLDNPVHTRMHEIGLAVDEDVRAVEAFGERLDAFAKIITTLPTTSAAAVSSPADQQSVKAALEALGIFTDAYGRIGIGGPPVVDPRDDAPLLNYQLTIHGKIGANIAYLANEALVDPQRGGDNDPQRVHIGSDGVSQDGGRRRGMGALYRDKPLPDGTWTPLILDEFRSLYNNGTDSRSNECWQIPPVEPDSRFPGFAKPVDDEVVNGVRVKSGQDLYLYPKARNATTGEEEVHFVAGKPGISVRGSTSVWYDGSLPAKT